MVENLKTIKALINCGLHIREEKSQANIFGEKSV